MTSSPAATPDIASAIVGHVDVLRELGVLSGCSGSVAAAPTALADRELMVGVVQVEALARIVDSLRLRMAGEVAARSDAAFGDEGLARSQNFSTPAKFLAANTGTRVKTAQRLIKIGGRLRTTVALTGMPNPPAFPAVADAVAAGLIGLDVAEAITERLWDVASRTGFTDALTHAEGTLVDLAQQSVGGLCHTADSIDAFAVRMREHLDPDGAEPRDADLHERRCLTLTPLDTGMTRINGLLPPAAAGHLFAALVPFTSPRIPTFTTAPGTTGGSGGGGRGGDSGDSGDSEADAESGHDALFDDTRTRGQKLADGLIHLVTMAAGLPGVPRLNGAAPTVNLHATLGDVVTGRGVGWIDGLTEPVPYSTVEELLCHADVITTLFGERGQVLQHGKTKRLFTAAQNRALAARDGGCVWPDCEAPPSWCESHHVKGWNSSDDPAGRTDLDNGALLCHFHHSHVHKTRWKLVMRQGVPHFIPPDWLDWTQTPRPAQQNRAREYPLTG